jgi:hypothetical protein
MPNEEYLTATSVQGDDFYFRYEDREVRPGEQRREPGMKVK